MPNFHVRVLLLSPLKGYDNHSSPFKYYTPPIRPSQRKKAPQQQKEIFKRKSRNEMIPSIFFIQSIFPHNRPLTFNSLVLLLSHFLLIQSSGILPASPKAYSLIRNELPPWQTSVEPEPNLVSGRVTFRFYVRCLRSTFLSGRIFRGLILV